VSPKVSAGIVLDVPTAKVRAGAQAAVGVAVHSPAGAIPTGAVVVSAGGKSVSGTLVGGAATVRLPALPPGTYDVSASYGGDGTVGAATATAKLRVAKISPAVTVVLPKSKVTTSQRAVVRVKVVAKGASRPGGTITVSVRGKKVKGTVKAGKATVRLPKLAAGNYTVKVVYSGTSLIDKRTRNGVTLKVTR
jgi:hypothetical protein